MVLGTTPIRVVTWSGRTAPGLPFLSSEPAVERGIETDRRLPANGDAARVANELRHHLAIADGA
ncbi:MULTISPECIES: hypothetical protein [unclassified Streptomyces]|uniref:hypothetical protein n=1 Tax=unclassified Streptomyces TaxID=2593676 RepID=UPI001BECA643|nr:MULTISPECIES: hypothetical protein [unclassified Streptomyces]MBT2408458.1 hypothetical protein [Streptomyces sp. ISL-21]MBT2611898.1 hypothetical protein [Streptomyces sp. ISL-87]